MPASGYSANGGTARKILLPLELDRHEAMSTKMREVTDLIDASKVDEA